MIAGLAALALPAQAELYRYLDDNGVTVLDRSVPSEYIKHGYEVLDHQGRVKQTISAAPTPQELKAHRAASAAQERQLQEDKTLLRLYSSVPDLERAKKRQLTQIESLIETTRANVATLKSQREELQRRAAGQERAGREVDASILRELAEVAAETDRLERLIAAQQAEIKEVEANFKASLARLETLLGS